NRHQAFVHTRNRERHLHRLGGLGHTRNHHFAQSHYIRTKHKVLAAGSCRERDLTLLRYETHRTYTKNDRLPAYTSRRNRDRIVPVGVRTHRDIQLGDIHVCPVERLALLGGYASVDNRILSLRLERNCDSRCQCDGQPSELPSKRTHHVLFFTPSLDCEMPCRPRGNRRRACRTRCVWTNSPPDCWVGHRTSLCGRGRNCGGEQR